MRLYPLLRRSKGQNAHYTVLFRNRQDLPYIFFRTISE